MRWLAILCVRNEGAFLLDWLAHHRAVGFTDVLVFSNDCADGTDRLLDRLHALGQLEHVHNPGPYHQRGVQFTALNAAARHPRVRQADWILPLDIDEFVNIHVGDGTIPALLHALPDATAITLTWRLFGNAGEVHYSDHPVPDRFTLAAPEVLRWPWRASMFKTLYANDGTYRAPGVHRPRRPQDSRLGKAAWFDGQGRSLPDRFKTKQMFSPFGRENTRLVQLNHYPLGAMESFVLKAARGRAVHGDDRLGLDYWVERNWCDVEDKSIQKYRPERERIKAELLADPQIAELHASAVAWRHMRFEDLMQQEPYRALFGRLLMTSPTQQVPTATARQLLRIAAQSTTLCL